MEGEWARGLFLSVRLQIDYTDGVGAGLAGLQFDTVRGRLLHGMAMCHHVSGGIRELVLHTLRSTHGGRSLGHEEHEQEDVKSDLTSRVRC